MPLECLEHRVQHPQRLNIVICAMSCRSRASIATRADDLRLKQKTASGHLDSRKGHTIHHDGRIIRFYSYTKAVTEHGTQCSNAAQAFRSARSLYLLDLLLPDALFIRCRFLSQIHDSPQSPQSDSTFSPH